MRSHIQDASYPYVVQSLMRAGDFTHYAGEEAPESSKSCHAGGEVDLCACRTTATFRGGRYGCRDPRYDGHSV